MIGSFKCAELVRLLPVILPILNPLYLFVIVALMNSSSGFFDYYLEVGAQGFLARA